MDETNHRNSRKKKIFYLMSIISLIGVLLFASTMNTSAYWSQPQANGNNKVDSKGEFYLKINGNASSSVTIKFTRGSSPGWRGFLDSPTTWTAAISGTNRHNIRFSNGSSKMSVTTKADTYGQYVIYNLPIYYDMPAHYYVDNAYYDRPDINARLNFNEYGKDNYGKETAYGNGKHSTSSSTRYINLQVNASHAGVKTYDQTWYQSTMLMHLTRSSHTVTQYHFYQTTNGWTKFNTTSTGVTDGNWFSPYNVTAPSGYHAGNNYGYYSSGGTSLGNGTVGSNGFTVCDNNIVHVHYYPNTYYVYYNANGGTGAPPTQSFTYNWGAHISSVAPKRTGYTFAGWDYSGNHFSPGQAIPNGWGTFTLTAKWNINQYYLDVNGYLDGKQVGSLGEYGTCDVYINGKLVANDVSDFYTAYNYGSSYSISDIKAKPGYRYNGVYTGSSSGTIDTHKSIYLSFSRAEPPSIKAPVNTFADKTPFYDKTCQYLVVLEGDAFNPLKYVSASDAVDGDITSKVKMTKNTVPIADGKVTRSGLYDITYSVTNSGKLTATKDIKVFVNQVPKINAQDRYLMREDHLTVGQLLSKVTVADYEEKIIFQGNKVTQDYIDMILEQMKDSVHVDKHKQLITFELYEKEIKLFSCNSNTASFSSLAIDFTQRKGKTYKVVVKVEDSHMGKSSKTFNVELVKQSDLEKQPATKIPRYISKTYLSSLRENSIWVQDAFQSELLSNSVENESPVMTIHFNKTQIHQIKGADSKPSSESNILFSERYLGH